MTPKDRSRAIRDLADCIHWASAAIDTLTDEDMDDIAAGEIRYAADGLARALARTKADLAERAKRVAALQRPTPSLVGPINDLIEDATS